MPFLGHRGHFTRFLICCYSHYLCGHICTTPPPPPPVESQRNVHICVKDMTEKCWNILWKKRAMENEFWETGGGGGRSEIHSWDTVQVQLLAEEDQVNLLSVSNTQRCYQYLAPRKHISGQGHSCFGPRPQLRLFWTPRPKNGGFRDTIQRQRLSKLTKTSSIGRTIRRTKDWRTECGIIATALLLVYCASSSSYGIL